MSEPTPSAVEIHRLYTDVVQQLSDEIGRGLKAQFEDEHASRIRLMSRPLRVRDFIKMLLFLEFMMPPPWKLRAGGPFLGPAAWPVAGVARLEQLSPQTIAALIQLNEANLAVLGRPTALVSSSLVLLTGGVGLIATMEQIGIEVSRSPQYITVALLAWFVIGAARSYFRALNWRRRLVTVGWVLRVVAELKGGVSFQAAS